MKIWLVQNGEPTPIDRGMRLLRIGILAQLLADAHHDVTWWNSTFLHQKKQQRYDQDHEVEVGAGYRIRFVWSPGYPMAVHWRRLWDHWVLMRRFAKQIRRESPPDVILASLPTPGLSYQAVRYGQRHSVPVIIDIRDTWPDVLCEAFPPSMRWAARMLLAPMQRHARVACKHASAIFGHAPAFVDWGLRLAERDRREADRDFPFGYSIPELTPAERQEALDYWAQQGISPRSDCLRVVFFGALGRVFDLRTVIQAANILRERSDIEFVICGSGDLLEAYRAEAASLPNIHFPGWVDLAKLRVLMSMSDAGLAAYASSQCMLDTISNKAIEYLSGGIPILLSLESGHLFDIIQSRCCGRSYNGNPEAMAQVAVELRGDQTQLQQMKANARQLFEDRYIAANVYSRMAKHIETIAFCDEHDIAPAEQRAEQNEVYL